MSLIGSYAGFYNNNYLRSSYEYVYAKILENQNIKYKVEAKIYLLPNGTTYKPDFFIYNNSGKLIKIIEIKTENKEYFKKGKEKVRLLQNMIDIPVNIIQSKELKILCLKYNIDFDKLKKEWINSDKTSQNHILLGKYNPMYGHKQTQKSKIQNGLKTKKRFENKNFRIKHSNAVKKAMGKVDKTKLGHPKKRIIRYCKLCGKSFEAIITSKQEYCSTKCGSTAMFHLASQIKHDKNISKFKKIKEDVINFAINNKDLINKTKYNKINTSLGKYFDNILSKYNLSDHRNIFFAFYGVYSNKYKQLLTDLKKRINL